MCVWGGGGGVLLNRGVAKMPNWQELVQDRDTGHHSPLANPTVCQSVLTAGVTTDFTAGKRGCRRKEPSHAGLREKVLSSSTFSVPFSSVVTFTSCEASNSLHLLVPYFLK